mmetsp:Transcript_27233/g.48940  ORF Transcript_27233/g.48940 Transcript_27233/m.48940 type:complete len:480 (-) Transcript_27233:382-1821(-)
MGNTANPPADPPSINPKLNYCPVPYLSPAVSVQSPVLLAYTACQDGVYRIVVVHRRGVEAYDPATGAQLPCSFAVRDRNYIKKAGRCLESSREDVLILADITGTFALRQAFTLSFVEEFGSAEHKYISSMICPLPDLIFAGFLTGDVRVFEFGNSTPKFRVIASELGAVIRSLAYSKQHKLLFIGTDNSYERQDGSYVKLAHTPIPVYSMSSIATQGKPQPVKSLEGLESASCTALELIDSRNLAIAASSVSGDIHVWDFITGTKLLKLNPSGLIDTSALLTTMSAFELNRDRQIVTVGFNDGSILASELVFNSGLRSFVWQPSKLVKPKSSSLDSNLGITFIQHDSETDILLIGTDLAQLRLLSNFKAEHEKKEAPVLATTAEPALAPTSHALEEVKSAQSPTLQSKHVSEEALRKVRDRVEGKRKSRNDKISGFNRFLQEKKPILLEENPDLAMKEIVMQVSALWGELDEAERLRYD